MHTDPISLATMPSDIGAPPKQVDSAPEATSLPAAAPSHVPISPAILYWGTPVVIVSSCNPDGTTNLALISSAFWLGHRAILGMGASGHTPANMARTRQCVLNLPSDALVPHINALALTTGDPAPPASKIGRGYRHVADKWALAGLTRQRSERVAPHRVGECPVQMECELVATHEMMSDWPDRKGAALAMEVKVLKIHIAPELRLPGFSNRVDPDRWRPVIMSFQHMYGLSGRLGESTLAQVPEELYRPLTKSDVVRDEHEETKVEVQR